MTAEPRVPLPLVAAFALSLALGCARQPPRAQPLADSADPALPEPAASWERDSPLAPLPGPPEGAEVDLGALAHAVTAEKVRLGRWLFFDRRLSVDGTVACATCHRPEHAFSEPLPRSRGVRGQEGTRKAPPLVNLAQRVHTSFFWDGRAATLPEQALGPITNPVEMGHTAEGAAAAVGAVRGYRRAFAQAFGDERVDAVRIADALAAYQATLFSGGSAYDRFQAGDDGALGPLALSGMGLFFGRARCNACHLGPAFTDGRFHNVGVGYRAQAGPLELLAIQARRQRPWAPLARPPDGDAVVWARLPGAPASGLEDAGRYAVTGAPGDLGAFKTPTLRDLGARAPYMHDGSSPDLEDSVLRYLSPAENPWLDVAMREVQIEPADVGPLVAFLRALEAPAPPGEAPPSLPR